MSDEMIERVAKALFRSRYPNAESEGFWPDRLDETVNGPPFEAGGYRDMARAAIEAMREHLIQCAACYSEQAYYAAIEEIDDALGKITA